jgi:signal peptidase II
MTDLFTRASLIGLGIAFAIFAADQWLKGFVVDTLGLDQVGDHYPLLPFFDFTRTNNYGVSLGMFPATSLEMRWALVGMTALLAAFVFVWMLREKKMWDIAALALILGGALGNIYDRFLYGYVIDFADFHIGTFRPFMIFNLADAAITIGVVILLARALFMGEKPATEQDKDQSGSNPAETD